MCANKKSLKHVIKSQVKSVNRIPKIHDDVKELVSNQVGTISCVALSRSESLAACLSNKSKRVPSPFGSYSGFLLQCRRRTIDCWSVNAGRSMRSYRLVASSLSLSLSLSLSVCVNAIVWAGRIEPLRLYTHSILRAGFCASRIMQAGNLPYPNHANVTMISGGCKVRKG